MLKVKHIIVCGHYGCGGVHAALENRQHGMIDNWLRNIKDIYCKHQQEIDAIPDVQVRADHMCELNVIQQVSNVCYTTIVQNAWHRGQQLAVHGWIYGLKDGLINDLALTIDGLEQLPEVHQMKSSD